MPVPVLRALTFAPATVAPCGSIMVPTILPRKVCARAGKAVVESNAKSNEMETQQRRRFAVRKKRLGNNGFRSGDDKVVSPSKVRLMRAVGCCGSKHTCSSPICAEWIAKISPLKIEPNKLQIELQRNDREKS